MADKGRSELPLRRHGYKARAAVVERLFVSHEQDCAPRPSSGERLRTMLTFRSENQAYSWITDRGRSRLIKH